MSANAITVYEKINDPLGAAKQMGEIMAKSQMFGVSADAGAVCAMVCMAEGIHFVDFFKKYHVIKGRLSRRADSLIAEFVQAGGSFVIKQNDPDACEIEFTWKGNQSTRRITWEDAQQARWPWKDPSDHSKGLKDNWSTPLDREGMLYSRVVSTHLRRTAPELFSATYTSDEIQDEPGIPDPVLVQQQQPAISIDEAVG